MQPFELESTFSGIGASSFQIANDVDGRSTTGVMSGVNLDLSDTDTAHSVDFFHLLSWLSAGTDLTQTETLSFTTVAGGGAITEPSTWMLLLVGFAGLGFTGLSRSRRRVEVAKLRRGAQGTEIEKRCA